ncbi:MAG: hypothetical protein CMD48_05755 [Gammaproteobacteria bacterium]|jgi:hypothetical protein|nr:hypothetical protein [Gammaproteobacteria bacterium]|tara:strand:- start:4198 stop:4431 length:234 start_codon:yes stop_codon:yes gene_type:complete
MLDAINRVSRILWEFTKFLALIVAVAILISTLFGNNVPFFGGILENTRIVVETLGSEGLGLIIAIIIILSVWNSRSS